MAPSRGYNSASGTLFRMKLSEDIEQKLRKTMLVLCGHQSGFTQVKRIKRLFLRKQLLPNNTSVGKNDQ